MTDAEAVAMARALLTRAFREQVLQQPGLRCVVRRVVDADIDIALCYWRDAVSTISRYGECPWHAAESTRRRWPHLVEALRYQAASYDPPLEEMILRANDLYSMIELSEMAVADPALALEMDEARVAEKKVSGRWPFASAQEERAAVAEMIRKLREP